MYFQVQKYIFQIKFHQSETKSVFGHVNNQIKSREALNGLSFLIDIILFLMLLPCHMHGTTNTFIEG